MLAEIEGISMRKIPPHLQVGAKTISGEVKVVAVVPRLYLLS